MKRTLNGGIKMKKLLSLILAAVMAFCACIPAFAQESGKAETALEPAGGYPVIIVRGMDFTGLFIDYGTENQHNCMGDINIGGILKAVGSALLTKLFKNDRKAATHILIKELEKIFGGYACNEDGSSKYNVGTEKLPGAIGNYPEFFDRVDYEFGITRTAAEKFGRDKVYYFNYDWRLDPMQTADEINETVETALREHNCDKVNLVNCSMGGLMSVAYMTKYGTDKINRLICLSSTWCGTYVTSDLLKGAVVIDENRLSNFLLNLSDNFALKALIKVLKFTGIIKLVTKLAMKFDTNNKDQVYDEFLGPIFGNMLPIWALVLPEDYDACIKYMFERPGTKEARADFIAKTAELQEMMKNRDAMIKSAVENGMEIAVAATYDSPVAPVYERSYVNGDAALETPLMSGKAKIAPYGETLESADSSSPRVSPDKVCDTTDALYPDSTWLTRGAPHVSGSYGTDYADFIIWLLSTDNLTVTANPQYPAFMKSASDQHLELWK